MVIYFLDSDHEGRHRGNGHLEVQGHVANESPTITPAIPSPPTVTVPLMDPETGCEPPESPPPHRGPLTQSLPEQPARNSARPISFASRYEGEDTR